MNSNADDPYRPPATEPERHAEENRERDLLAKSAIAGIPAAIMVAIPGTICVGLPAAIVGDIAYGDGGRLGFLVGTASVPLATWVGFILFRRYLFARPPRK